MAKKEKLTPVLYCGDFETTVDDDTTIQNSTEVWAAPIVKLWTEDVHVFGSIDGLFNWLKVKNEPYIIIYYHNIKFDGSFILDWALKQGFRNGFENVITQKFKSKFDLENGEMSYIISSKGQWYEICLKFEDTLIEIRDSLKLLPFTLRAIGKSFKTKHQKLEMDYKGDHYANCPIAKDEMEYIKNDVLVLKEALEFMFSEGHNKLTIGSCCLEEYKKFYSDSWKHYFPDLTDYALNEEIYGSPNADEYIRKSYRGGWCYLVKGKEGTHYKGTTCDVNSLYPSVMHSESGNYYPIGVPYFWKGAIPKQAIHPEKYFFVRIRCRFKLKEGYLPWVQIKGSPFYCPTECLEDSDFTYFDKDSKSWKKTRYMIKDGEQVEAKVTLTFTCTDYELFKTHYEVLDEEVLDGCWFYAMKGIFDGYINKYAEIKKTSTGAKRTLAKLFLNNLYGKMATSPDSSYKVARLRDDGVVTFSTVVRRDKETVFIPVGSAITSYAKNFTIKAAQMNYYGVDKAGFIYADTDSIHCDLSADQIKGITIHPTNFNCWKAECSWDIAVFVRQKTYIEHVTHEDLKPVDTPYYSVKCAGLPENCKQIFIKELEAGTKKLSDFTVGLELDGKLLPRRINGGIVLTETTFKMH
ncbi:MAG TPA: DNA polymerase [Pseudothermotoga sp.]